MEVHNREGPMEVHNREGPMEVHHREGPIYSYVQLTWCTSRVYIWCFKLQNVLIIIIDYYNYYYLTGITFSKLISLVMAVSSSPISTGVL